MYREESEIYSCLYLNGGIKRQLNNEDDIYLMYDLKEEYYSLKCYFTIYSNGAPGDKERRGSHISPYLKIAKNVSLLSNTGKLHF